MKDLKLKIEKRKRRIRRTRSKIFGTAPRPRLAVFKSLKHVYAQLIDDENSRTLAASSDLTLKNLKAKTRLEKAFKVGEDLAKKALAKKINTAVFDKRGYKYHGIVKAVAEGARKAGLKF